VVEIELVETPETELRERLLGGLLKGFMLGTMGMGDGEWTVERLAVLAELDGKEDDEREDTSSLIMSTRWSARERLAKRRTLLYRISVRGTGNVRNQGRANIIFYLSSAFQLI
jgi:hypothetical protein